MKVNPIVPHFFLFPKLDKRDTTIPYIGSNTWENPVFMNVPANIHVGVIDANFILAMKIKRGISTRACSLISVKL